MANCTLGFPIYNDPSVSYTPTYAGGDWESDLPLTHLSNRKLSKVTRSTDTELSSTRFNVDLQTARSVGLIAIPKHTLSKTGAYVRVLGQLETFLFDYEAGDDITAKGGTFARADAATCATYVDRNGIVRTAAANIPRDAHFIGGVRHLLLEQSRTNLCLRSEDFGTTWTAVGTPTRSAAAHTASGVTLDLIGDDAGGNERYQQGITFTGDGTKSISVFCKKGTSPASRWMLSLVDGTVGAYRARARIQWSGNAPVIQLLSEGASFRVEGPFAGDVYRVSLNATGVIAANANQIGVWPVSDDIAATGNLYAGGAQAENVGTASSYIKTLGTTVTRAADSLKFPFTAAPQEMTVYADVTEAGTGLMGASARIWEIGNTSGGEALFVYAATTRYDTFLSVTAGARLSQPLTAAPSYGDRIETRTVLAATGTVMQGTTINSGSETLGGTSATITLPAAWNALTITLNDAGSGAGIGLVAFRSLRVLAGTKTRTEMRASVYDSGWLNAWPSGVTAEDADGINVPFVHIPSSAQSGRYWSIQIDDYDNADGCVDLARLVIAGAYTPTVNFNVGARLGLEDDTDRKVTDGGAAIYEAKPVRRTTAFVLDHLQNSEAFNNAWIIQRRLGKSGQLFFVFDEDDTDYMHERSFLGVLRELTALEFAYADRSRMAFAIAEEL